MHIAYYVSKDLMIISQPHTAPVAISHTSRTLTLKSKAQNKIKKKKYQDLLVIAQQY